jgi:hypothetical protein
MYKFKKSLIAFAGLFALLGVIALITPRTGVSQNPNTANPAPKASPTPTDVNVVNTPTVNVGSMPTVNGTVNIANTPSDPVPVAAPTPQTVLAFTETKSLSLASAVFGPYDVSSFRDVRLSFAVDGNNCTGGVFYRLFLSNGTTAFVSPSFDHAGTNGSTLIGVPGQKSMSTSTVSFFKAARPSRSTADRRILGCLSLRKGSER